MSAMIKQPLPVVAIVGPTAVGKTALSLELARRLNGEIISVDSRQVYRYLDVGSDKIDGETRKEIIHHLLDVADPDQEFSAADFALQARDAAFRIARRGRTPLFAGGTPFYFNALFGGVLSEDAPKDSALRRELEAFAEREGKEALHRRLREVDPERAASLHPNDVRRVVRALEISTLTSMAATEWFARAAKVPGAGDFDVLYIGLNRERRLLFEAIEGRVREQFAGGFVEEVEWLLAHGYDERFPSMQGFGYKDILEYLRGRCTLEEAADRDISQTKAFSRRQMTWFCKFSPIVWYDTQECSAESLAATIEKEALAHIGKG